MTLEFFTTKFHRAGWKQKQPFTFWCCVDNFYPWKDIVGIKVSKLRSIAELRAFYGMFFSVYSTILIYSTRCPRITGKRYTVLYIEKSRAPSLRPPYFNLDKPHSGPEPTIDLRPALQQASELPTELRCTLRNVLQQSVLFLVSLAIWVYLSAWHTYEIWKNITGSVPGFPSIHPFSY